MFRSSLLIPILACVFPSAVQNAATPQSLTIQVSSATPWTDSGLALKPGDSVSISVERVSSLNSGNSLKICDPTGSGDSANSAGLPVPEAGSGALIAKLEASAAPTLVGAATELHIDKESHLFLGMNLGKAPVCQGVFEVKVQTTTSGTGGTNAGGTLAPSRSAQLKSQLASAADVFLSGQFGISKPGSNAENATSANSDTPGGSTVPTLTVSNAALDGDLRKQLDDLPRRVNDQFQNQGDMVNFVIIGSEKNLQDALQAADWHVADTDNRKAVLNAVLQTYDSKDYLAMPMSVLYLFGRKQDFGYEMAEPIAMVASRHHFRIWKAPFTWKGQEVWVGAGTHDIGFAKDKRNNSVTHKIDPAVDGERDNIGISLQKSNKAKTFSYYLPPNPVQEAKNATGDGYHSDGRLLVVFLQ